MKIGIVGIGKVGSCELALFTHQGHDVLGYDIRTNPLSTVSSTEKDLVEYVEKYNLKEKIVSLEELVSYSELIFIIVPTPSLPDGCFSTEYVEDIINRISEIDNNKIIIINSTIPPKTCNKLSYLVNELYYNPLYIRLGSVMEDLQKIRFIMIGCSEKISRDFNNGKNIETYGLNKLIDFWSSISMGDFYIDTWETIEITKLALNCIMTTNISLINKLGEIYEKSEANIEYLYDLLPLDKRFKLETFKTGTGYGGPCLPRDNRMMQYYCENIDIESSLFRAVDEVNIDQLGRMMEKIEDFEKIGVYGIGYKIGSDVIEDSQGFILVGWLRENGKIVEIYDPYNKELSTVESEEELEEKTDIVVLTLPYKTNIKHISLWR